MKLPGTFSDEMNLHVIIETPRGSRNRFDYNHEFDLFKLKKMFPAGTSLPFPMGFIPQTKGEDGDPLDVFILTDDDTYPGCLIESRVIGVLKARQAGVDGKLIRNDRFVAVPIASKELQGIVEISMYDQQKLQSIIDFCLYYNKCEGKYFEVTGIGNSEEALACIRDGM